MYEKKELENLQDLLVQNGKEKEELNIRLSNCNLRCFSLENENTTITQVRNYLKVENEKVVKNMNDLDKEYTTQIKGLKRIEAQREHEIIFLKAENEKCNRNIDKLDTAYKSQIIELN